MFGNNHDSIPMAFWETLGQYVYGYYDSNGQPVYIGKGNGNRALSHTKTKNYSLDNLYIIARNLENFRADKQDLQSFILESYLISTFNPTDNSVSGHYKECFVMAKFSELFEEFTKDQHDNFESLPEWFTDNYEKLVGRLNVLTIKAHTHSLEFQTRQQMQVFLDVSTGGDVSLKVAIWASEGEAFENRFKQLNRFCTALEIDTDQIVKAGNRNIYTMPVTDLDFALRFIDDFFS